VLCSQRFSPLRVERLVDRLWGDSHRLIIEEVEAQAVRDLLKGSRTSPNSGPDADRGVDRRREGASHEERGKSGIGGCRVACGPQPRVLVAPGDLVGT
jgi:hypothetical protein